MLIQSGLHKTLKGRPNNGTFDELIGDGVPGEFDRGSKKSNRNDKDWEEMDLIAASAI